MFYSREPWFVLLNNKKEIKISEKILKNKFTNI